MQKNSSKSFFSKWRFFSLEAGLKNKNILIILLLTLFSSFTEIIGIGLFYPIFLMMDNGVKSQEAIIQNDTFISEMYSFFNNFTGLDFSLGYLLIIVVLLFYIRHFAMYLKAVYQTTVLYTIKKNLVDKMFGLFLKASSSFHDSMPIGLFSNVLVKEVHASMLGVMAPIELLSNAIMLTVLLSALLFVSWELTFFTFIIFILAAGIAKIWIGKSEQVGKDVVVSNNNLSTFLIERIKSPRLVRLSRTELAELKSFKRLSEIQKIHTIRTSVLISRTDMIFEPIMISVSLFFVFVAYSILQMELAIIGTYIVLSLRILPALKSIVVQWQKIKTLMGSVDAVKNHLQKLDESQEFSSEGRVINNLNNAVVYKNVSYQYPNTQSKALKDINIVFSAGTLNALVGPSGGGKSTLIDLLPMLRKPSFGEITIDGISISEFNLEDLRSIVSYAPQNPQIFSGTIKDHISYGKPNSVIHEVKKAAELADIAEFIESLPNKYNTIIGDDGVGLSGGQRQRLDLARAVIANSPILILDEPTSNLDSETEHRFNQSLKNIHNEQKNTIIYITHRLTSISFMDHIIVLDKGVVIEQGNHKDLISNNQWYTKAFKENE